MDDGVRTTGGWLDDGTFSRRRLIQTGGVAVVTGLVGSAPGVAVARTPTAAGDIIAADLGRPATATAAATINAALASEVFEGLDPTTAGAAAISVNDFLYEALYRIDPLNRVGEPVPELAIDLPEPVAPTVYRVRLREGVTFHDGSPLTANDVKFTIDRIKAPETNSFFARYLDLVTDATVIDDHEIELTLRTPTTLLAHRLVLVKVLSEAAVRSSAEALSLAPVGSGPCQVVRASTGGGQIIQLAAFPGYSGNRSLEYEEVDLHQVPNPNARVSGLKTGEWRVIESAPAASFESLREDPALSAEDVPGDAATILIFHNDRPPFDDVRARQAVLYAIDRDAITQATYFGHAEPAWTGYVRANRADYEEPDRVYAYDPDRSRSLLDEMELSDDGRRVNLLVPSDIEDLASQGPIVEQNLRDVGFDPMIVAQGFAALLSELSAGNHHIMLLPTNPSILGASDTEFMLRWLFYGYTPRQHAFWSGDDIDHVEALLDEALAAPDDTSRRERLVEVQNVVQDLVPIAPLHFRTQLTAWDRELEGFQALGDPGILLDSVSG